MQNKSIHRIGLVTALLLLVPLTAMLFTDEVVWGPEDFLFAGTLIFGTGLTFELVAKKAGNLTYRFAFGMALAAAFILIWANAAVGIIGDEGDPTNLMYAGVLAVAVIGTVIARFEPHRMVRALFATALAHALVTGIALIAGMQRYTGSSGSEILKVNAFFFVLWVGSALLFRHAARRQSGDGFPSASVGARP